MQRSWPVSVLLVSSDMDFQTQIRQTFKDSLLTVAKDTGQASKLIEKREYDLVFVESKRNTPLDWTPSNPSPETSKTVFISGSRRSLRQTVACFQSAAEPKVVHKAVNGTSVSLEDLIQSKVSDFVKGMRSGSARNLYPILISAVERPLLSSTLQETQGNQIQAARLLGMNRNTLRKKITELHIPLARTKSAQKIAL